MKKRVSIILFAALLLLCACQPTPEVDAVKQKDTNVLIDTVLSGQLEKTETGEAPVPVKDQMPDRFAVDFYTPAQNVHVVVDAPIRVLTDGTFPMVRVERAKLTTEQRMTLAKRLLHTDKLYVWSYRVTREDLEREIANLIQEPTSEQKAEWMREDPENTEERWNEIMENRKKNLAQLQEQYRNLTEGKTEPFPEWDGIEPNAGRPIMIVADPYAGGSWELSNDHIDWRSDDADMPILYRAGCDVDRDGSYWADVFCQKANGEAGTERLAPERYGEVHEGASISAIEAAQVALSCLEGYGSFGIADIYWTNNAANGGQDAYIAKTWAYGIRLTPAVHGAGMPYCNVMASENDPINDVMRGWEYSHISAVVDGSGKLLAWNWVGVLKETEVYSESAPLLPFAEIEQLFEQQINRKLAYEEMQDATLTVDNVQLGLFRIREQNDMDHGLLVPAWVFRGTLVPSENSGWAGLTQRYDTEPVLIINAIDGSVIDPQKGY